jgi:phosphotransferase system enzyme I (PtsP)
MFHSFAGVPIVRRERAVGVLCVQHADPRAYEDVEIEALQTVAMVLSELIAGAGLVDKKVDSARRAIRAGAAAGPQARHRHGPRLRGLPPAARADRAYRRRRTEAERHRVYSAFRKMRDQIDTMANITEFGTAGEHQEILPDLQDVRL